MLSEKIDYFGVMTKYLWYYLKIVHKIQNQQRVKVVNDGLSMHHVMPKCIFKQYKDLKNNKWNGVLVTPREHFVLHLLIWKHYKSLNDKHNTIKMAHPLVKMSSKNSHMYDIACKAKSDARKAEGNILTASGVKRISDYMKNNNPAKIMIVCEHCGIKMGSNNFYSYHGDNCRQNPNYIVCEKEVIKYRKISEKNKGFKTLQHIITGEKIVNNTNEISFYGISTDSRDKLFVLRRGEQNLIFANRKSVAHFMSMYVNRTIHTFIEWSKINQIYTKEYFGNRWKRYYLEVFEGCIFEMIRVGDFDINNYTKYEIYTGSTEFLGEIKEVQNSVK